MKNGNTIRKRSREKWSGKYGNSTWGYLLCRLATGGRLGTGRCAAGAHHTERCWKQTQSVICAAITSQMNKAKLPTHVELDSQKYALVKDSVVLLEQLRTIDKTRLKDKVCHLDHQILVKIDKALEISLELYT